MSKRPAFLHFFIRLGALTPTAHCSVPTFRKTFNSKIKWFLITTICSLLYFFIRFSMNICRPASTAWQVIPFGMSLHLTVLVGHCSSHAPHSRLIRCAKAFSCNVLAPYDAGRPLLESRSALAAYPLRESIFLQCPCTLRCW